MLVVDTSVLIAWLRGNSTPQTEYLDQVGADQPIVLGDLVMMEILQGARNDADAARLDRQMRFFEPAEMVDRQAAVRAARHYRDLRVMGVTIRKQVDLLIGTFCIAHGHTLLHADRHFDPMAEHLGLKVVSSPDALH